MRLLLIRHGQTIDNVHGAIGTVVPGPGLTELGLEQAAAVPAALEGESIDAIVVSSMLRTHLTAQPLAEKLGLRPIIMDGLREITAGDLEGRTDEESIRTYMSTIFSWWHDFSARIPGGESGTEFHARYDGAIANIADRYGDGTVAVFSHGAAIRTWASWSSRNIDAEFSKGQHLENTGIVVLEGSPATGWLATSWQGTPVGGPALEDVSAPDPTGEPIR